MHIIIYGASNLRYPENSSPDVQAHHANRRNNNKRQYVINTYPIFWRSIIKGLKLLPFPI
jgi:hypothetical protein